MAIKCVLHALRQTSTVGKYIVEYENIRKKELRTSGSHMSVRSRRTSRSSSKIPNKEGIKIESNGTVIHVYGDTDVRVRAGEDGAASLVIGTASGKDSTYHSNSKSSGSRVGRSRGGSDIGSGRKDVIREEDGYEQATTQSTPLQTFVQTDGPHFTDKGHTVAWQYFQQQILQ